jgi:hypothetical protein
MATLNFTGDDLRRRLQAYDRTPFLDLLAIMLECAPSIEALNKMAEKSPEKYFLALGQLARTGGFTDKTETTHNVNLNIGQMSDSQLEDRARHLAEVLQLAPSGAAIDADFEVVDENSVVEPTRRSNGKRGKQEGMA